MNREELNKKPTFKYEEVKALADCSEAIISDLQAQLAQSQAAVAELKERKCSHGPYKFWGTDECKLCGSGRIQLYYLEDKCLECQHAPKSGEVAGG